MTEPAIENLFREGRTFPPPAAFVEQATLSDPAVYEQAEADVEGWWVSHAERLRWTKPWDTVLEWDPPHAATGAPAPRQRDVSHLPNSGRLWRSIDKVGPQRKS